MQSWGVISLDKRITLTVHQDLRETREGNVDFTEILLNNLFLWSPSELHCITRQTSPIVIQYSLKQYSGVDYCPWMVI